jgi:hypothetical protein
MSLQRRRGWFRDGGGEGRGQTTIKIRRMRIKNPWFPPFHFWVIRAAKPFMRAV